MALTSLIVSHGDAPALPLAEIETLRLQVWSDVIGPQRTRTRFLADPVDQDAWHLGIREGQALVACGRLTLHHDPDTLPDRVSFAPAIAGFRFPCCLMNRLVVHPAHRGRGASKTIDEGRIRLARELGALELWVEAHDRRALSLSSRGFTVHCASGDREIAGEWLLLRLSLG